MKTIIELIKGKVFSFIFFRYLGYGIQFVNSLLIAKFLGPFYFGIYGFSTLMLQYINYSHLGIPYSFNVELSKNIKKIDDNEKRLLGNSMLMLFLIALILLFIVVVISNVHIDLFEKYRFNNYIFIIIFIVIFDLLCQLFINLYRAFHYFKKISFYQITPQFLVLISISFFYNNNEKLLLAVFLSQLIGLIISFIVFNINKPLIPIWNINLQKGIRLIIRGISLLMYNFMFSLILISSRTMISIFYSVEDMGSYSLINSLSNAIGMLLGSISFIFFSKMISRLKSDVPNENVKEFIEKVNYWYFLSTSFVIFLAISIVPTFSFFFPEYSNAIVPFSFLLLTQLVISYLFGYAEFLIARGREQRLIFLAIISIFINVGGIFILYKIGLTYKYIPLVTLLAIGVYVVLARHYASRLMDGELGIVSFIYNFLMNKMFLSVLLVVLVNLVSKGYIFNFIGLISLLFVAGKDFWAKRYELFGLIKRNFI